MTTLLYDRDAELRRLDRRRVAIIGFGSQGHAHALNLRDSGVDVVVGLAPASASRPRAAAAGIEVKDTHDAAAESDIVMLLVPDTAQRAIYERDIRSTLRPGKTLMFAHGF